ncbi:hypothetical protein FHW19_000575 [Ochrobactrum anthropi]|nr:hypothetical protein [Brucella anthropi]
MNDLRFLGELAMKHGLDEEIDYIFDAYRRAEKELKKAPW